MPPIEPINQPKQCDPNLLKLLLKFATLHHFSAILADILDINGIE